MEAGRRTEWREDESDHWWTRWVGFVKLAVSPAGAWSAMVYAPKGPASLCCVTHNADSTGRDVEAAKAAADAWIASTLAAMQRDEAPRSPAREDVALTVGEAWTMVVEVSGAAWSQMRHVNNNHFLYRHWSPTKNAWGVWRQSGSDSAVTLTGDLPARLVPLADADAPPESRGPIGGES